ncbi:MAG: hypothetical protein ACLTUR_06655 [Paraclostridium sordellii]
MNIKDEFYKIDNKYMDESYVKSMRDKKKKLSNSDKRFLLAIIAKFKSQEVDKTLKAIRMYAIWNPDEAIKESRKKGVFRYKAYRFEENKVLFLIDNLLKECKTYLFSMDTIDYLNSKKQLSWLYDFYKNSEQKIIREIKDYHKKRIQIKKGNEILETAIFKDLLAYIDFYFHLESDNENNILANKNKINSYTKEEICEGISYIVYLYDSEIGIKQNINYFVDSKYILSNDIDKIILTACKVNQVEEWELCIDYFNYKVELIGKEWVIYDKTKILDKSIKMGYIRSKIQAGIHYFNNNSELKNAISISEVGSYIAEQLGDRLIEEVIDGKLSRYIFKFPELLFSLFEENGCYGNKLFKEEIIEINHCAKELAMTYDELKRKKVTKNCNLTDIILFKRFFLLIDEILSYTLFETNDIKKITQSLIPLFREECLIEVVSKFMHDRLKAIELLNIFTYRKDIKLDLQYTPFFNVSNGIIFSNTLVSKSNLLRNIIAYSYLSKNQIVNDDQGLEPLVHLCSHAFKKCKVGYSVQTNVKYKYMKNHGEIDVLVISDTDIILVECKCPLMPTNNFEMRSSMEHVEKANKQLDLGERAFNDKSFRKKYFKNWGIEDKNQNIKTCIVFGNRLFTGFNNNSHPIRYIHELDMVLNKGIIFSEIGRWSVWKGDEISHDDVMDFLSDEKSFIRFNFESMDEVEEFIYAKGKKITLKTYAYNMKKSILLYDSNLRIITSNNDLKQILLNEN